MYEENWRNLGIAVVKKAVDDYRICCKKNNKRGKREIEEFFLGDTFCLFTDLDGRALLEKLREEIRNEV